MKFYSSEDIERLAAEGQKELVLDETIALTDLARDVARQLGITLKNGSHPVTMVNKAPAPVTASRETAVQLLAKPKGCQHAPLTSTPPPATPTSGNSTPIVDRLVDMVKQIGKRPGNGSTQ